MRTVAAWAPERLAITHFGTWDDVSAHIEEMHAQLERWAQISRETGDAGYTAAMEEEMRAKAPDERIANAYLGSMPPKMLWAGWARYWAEKEKEKAAGREG